MDALGVAALAQTRRDQLYLSSRLGHYNNYLINSLRLSQCHNPTTSHNQLQRGDQRVWCRGEVGARGLAGGGDEGGAQLAGCDDL